MKEKIVCIEWYDASFNPGYYDEKEKTEFNPIKTKTAGFMVKSDRKSVIISQDRFYDEEDKLDRERHITTIPRGMIRKITHLRGE